MERDYGVIHTFDLAPMAAAVQKAETDWPEKKPDLERALASVARHDQPERCRSGNPR